MSKNTESFTPNTRFGATFLDVLFNKRAVNDKIMLDKQTGDLVYKRKTDGRIMWYSQENIQIYQFMSQLRSRSDAYNDYKYPDEDSPVYRDSYLMSCLLDVKDWTFDKAEDELEGTEHSLLKGEKLKNCYPDAFSVSQDANGFFIQLNITPKDFAYIQLLNSRYNLEYENYVGEDEQSLAKKKLFNEFNYASGQFNVNYTITWYDLAGEVKDTETADGYVCANELSFIPYKKSKIYKRNVVNSAKLTIKYISAPKLTEGLALCTTPAEKTMINAVKDNEDLSFQTMNFTFFITSTDDNLYLPNWVNHSEIMLLMGIEDMEAAMDRAASSGGGNGVVTSIHEPDEKTWKHTGLWLEMMRKFIPPSEEHYLGSPTTLGKLEDEMKGIEHVYTKFSLDKKSVNDFYVEKTGEINIGEEEVGEQS